MMSFARGGGLPGMPGMPGMAAAAGRKKKGKAKPAKGRRVSGNPAKAGGAKPAAPAAANPFGSPEGDIDYQKAAEALQLPNDFSKYLK
jgi:signal recognition particle subunit SRP54